MSALEGRYRRLVTLFPAAHRARYQEEMISTLMDGAADGQRLPRWRETLDLLWNAARLRVWREGERRGIDPRWRAAAAVFAPLTALLLATLYVRVPLGRLAWQQQVGSQAFDAAPLSPMLVVFAVTWLVVAVLGFAAWRWSRILAAALAVAAAVAHVVRHVSSGDGFATAWPIVVAATTIGVCLLLSGRNRLGAWHFGMFTVVTAVFAGSMWVDVMLADLVVKPFDEKGRPSGYRADMWGGNFPQVMGFDTVGAFPLLALLAMTVVIVVTLVRVGPAVRRRLLVLAAVLAVTHFFVDGIYSGTWKAMTAAQWLGLLLVPPVTFGIGVLLVRRRERPEVAVDGLSRDG